MKRLQRPAIVALILTGTLLTGCAGTAVTSADSASAAESTAAGTAITQISAGAVSFKSNDTYTTYTDAVAIRLSDAGMSSGKGYSVLNNKVTITDAGSYVLSGTLTNGQVVVNTDEGKDVRLILENAHITAAAGAPLYVKQADKVILSLPAGTDNRITDQTAATDGNEEMTAAVFCNSSLTINGSGALTVTADVNDGITSKDTLRVTGGTIKVTAADDGLVGRDKVLIRDGSLTISSGGDGIKSTRAEEDNGFVYAEGGTVTITAAKDGVQAATGVIVKEGSFTIQSGGGSTNAVQKTETAPMQGGWENREQESDSDTTETSSAKGMKAEGFVDISGGILNLNTADDSLHCNNTIRLSGGVVSAASGDDGVHADASLTVSGGKLTITKSYEGLEAKNITVSGGEIAVTASDDGINAGGGADGSSVNGRPGQNGFDADASAYLLISGGTLTVNASGDGLDSNGSLTIEGGTILVSGPTNGGNGTFDSGGSFVINGGTVLGVGSTGMLETPGNDSKQNTITVTGSSYEADSKVTVKDADGKELLSYTAPKAFAAITFSSSAVTIGSTYSFYVGDTLVKQAEATSVSTGGNEGGGFGGRGDGGGFGGYKR